MKLSIENKPKLEMFVALFQLLKNWSSQLNLQFDLASPPDVPAQAPAILQNASLLPEFVITVFLSSCLGHFWP